MQIKKYHAQVIFESIANLIFSHVPAVKKVLNFCLSVYKSFRKRGKMYLTLKSGLITALMQMTAHPYEKKMVSVH